MPIYRNDTSNPIVEQVEDKNGAEINIRIEPGKSFTTEFVLTNGNLTEVDPAPYYNPLKADTHEVTSTGPGDDQTITLYLDSKIISILNQTDNIVTAFLRALANTPGINCYPWTERIFNVGHNVDQIVFQFAAAGTIHVEERNEYLII